MLEEAIYEISKTHFKNNGSRNGLVPLQNISNSSEILPWAFIGVSYFGIFRVSVAEKLTKCFRTCITRVSSSCGRRESREGHDLSWLHGSSNAYRVRNSGSPPSSDLRMELWSYWLVRHSIDSWMRIPSWKMLWNNKITMKLNFFLWSDSAWMRPIVHRGTLPLCPYAAFYVKRRD